VTRTTIPVACVQLRAHDRNDFAARWPTIYERIADAARLGARLIVVPEGTLPAYVLGAEPVAPESLEPAVRALRSLARQRGVTIVYGGAHVEDGRTVNAAVAIDRDGEIAGASAKRFLWHFDRRWYGTGASLEPVPTSLGPLGLLVCADGRVPTIAATLARRGARMLVMPTAWVTNGRDPANLENVLADLFITVRARENAVPIAVANKVGVELGSVLYCGKSSLVAADGTLVARGGERDEETIVGTLELAPEREPRGPAVEPMTSGATSTTERARVAFTAECDGAELTWLAHAAALADADVALAPAACPGLPTLVAAAPEGRIAAAGVAALVVDAARAARPRGLVAERLAGIDLFVILGPSTDPWTIRIARTRASELRAYVVVLDPGRAALAIDPEGVPMAGTFGDYRIAAFAYDRARTAATGVAPFTDVAEGLRRMEALAAGMPAAARETEPV